MFFSRKLKKFKNIKHCFFSRENGYSKGLYQSLNCGLGSNDKKKDILKNLKFVSKKISCNEESLITLNQRHTNKVINFKNYESIKNKITGDAIVTKVKNIGIGILTADCASILFYDPKKKIIGCAHAGWKGALKGIIFNTVNKFKELKSKNEDLIAIVGPCIDKKNYQVRSDFLRRFINQSKKNKKFFFKVGNNEYLFDLRSYINEQLSILNIKNIENIEIDTFSESKFFYSYRRSSLNKEKDYGRCISVILMS
jgi:polyphenol oxidase